MWHGRAQGKSFIDVLALQGGTANLSFVKIVLEGSWLGRELWRDYLLVRSALHANRSLDTERAAGFIQRSVEDARRVIERLVESGIVEAKGSKRGRSSLLSAGICRRLGEKSA